MVECSSCHSTSVQSKGYRIPLVHRYICNKCGKNFQIDNRPKTEIKGDTKEMIVEKEGTEVKQKANQTLNVYNRTKERVIGLKLHPRESIDEVINRLIDEHYNKIQLKPTQT